jgi:hypothetical protein
VNILDYWGWLRGSEGMLRIRTIIAFNELYERHKADIKPEVRKVLAARLTKKLNLPPPPPKPETPGKRLFLRLSAIQMSYQLS